MLACIEVLPLVCAHALAGDFCGNRAAVSLVTERINGQGEVVLWNLGCRNNDGLICSNRTVQLVKLLFLRLLLNPARDCIAVHLPCGQLVAEMRRREEFQHWRVHEYKAAAVQRTVLRGNIRICAGEHDNRFLAEHSRHRGIRRDIRYGLRASTRLIGILRIIIKLLTANRNALDVVAVCRLCLDRDRAVMVNVLIRAVLVKRYFVQARALNGNCAVFCRIYSDSRLLQHRYFNCRIGVPAGQNRLVGVLCVLRCVLPAGNVVVLTYRSCEGHFGVCRNRIAAVDFRAADFRGDRRDIRVRDFLSVCVHCLEGDLCRLCCTDHDLDRVILRDIAQRKAGFCTRTDCRLAVYLPLLDRVVIVQIFQRKGHCRAVRNGIKVCLRSVRQLCRGLLLTDRRTGFVHVGEGHLMGLGVAERYADRVILFDVLQRQRFLTVQIGRTRPVIRLVVHHPACYRHTGDRRSRERHICAFRNLLSGRDCTAVL